MRPRISLLVLSALAVAFLGAMPAVAQQTEPRIALVVGNAGYRAGAIPTALNDAGLVAEALRSIGFEIVEGADLNQTDIVRTYRDFLAKVEASGPDTLAFVYFSGHALSFDGESFLLGVDARLARDSDIPIEGVRLSDLMRPFADSPARAKVMMIDAMRPVPFKPQGRALARGLEAIEPPKGMLVAYASAPGTVAPDRPGDYGAYATAIAEMLRAPGIDLDTVFTHVRSRTHQTTDGQQTPWDASALSEPIELVPPQAATAATAPPPPVRQPRPMRDIGPDEAYALAIEMDTLEGYSGFVQAYPGHPYGQRIWAMIRARREALAWMRAQEINTPRSYWTYLRRYPNGMYAFDAQYRLRRLGQPFAPPPGFAMMEFDDVPMALSGEPLEYEEVYRIGPPPPRSLYRAPRPAYLANLPPPRRRGGAGNAALSVLPALAVAIPVVAALAPAPRRAFTPGTGRAHRQGFGSRGGNSNRAAPASVTPNPAVAPSAVTPNAAIAPSTVSPSPGSRPPGWGPGRQGSHPPGATERPPAGGLPSGVANRTPPAAPGAAAPKSATPNSAAPNSAALPPANRPGSGVGRHPGGGPPPGVVKRTPPTASPPHANRTPPPAAVTRPTPPKPTPRPAAAAAAKPTAAPPPKPAAPPKRSACPAGKTLKPVAGKMVCA